MELEIEDSLHTTRKNQRNPTRKKFVCALDCESKDLAGFEVETKDSGNFVVHCHRNQPQVVLANTEGDGRLKLVSANVDS